MSKADLQHSTTVSRRNLLGVLPLAMVAAALPSEAAIPDSVFRLRGMEERLTALSQQIEAAERERAAPPLIADLKLERNSIWASEVWTVQATTIEGLQIKARMAAQHGFMCASTIHDILAFPL